MREFLKSLGLEAGTVNKIMREYGKNVTKYRSEISDYKNKVNSYESNIKDLTSKTKSNDKTLEDLQKLKTENSDLQAQLQMSGSNVKKEFSKFVKNEVMSMVDGKTDFGTALSSYKKSNPQYFGDTQVIKTSSSPSLVSGNQPTTTNSIMNDVIRNSV